LSLVQTGTAFATSNTGNGGGSITVGANITGGANNNNPVIECSWIVGDHNANGGSETEQYNYPTGKDLNPNGRNVTESTQTPTYSSGPTAPSFNANSNTAANFVYGSDTTTNTTAPCNETNTQTQPTMAAGTQTAPTSSGISFNINPFDSSTGSWVSDPGPAPKRVEIWSAVDYATSVIFDVFYPNGTEDTELGAIEIGGTQACSSYNTTGSLLNSMFSAAGPGADNEVSSYAWENSNSNGIVDHCDKGEKDLWYQAFTISKDDPSGKYTVEVRATSTTGTATSWFSFNVNPSIDLSVDFNSVQFANNNGVYEVSGDTQWSPNANAGGIACDNEAAPPATVTAGTCDAPTVINGGNEGLEVGVAYQPLTTNISGSNYLIDGPSFDANLGYNGSDELANDLTINSGTNPGTFGPVTWLTNNPGSGATGAQLVCPNDDPELDLSLHPATSTVQGTYTGTMEVMAAADSVTGHNSGGCLTDNNAPYIVNGAYKSVDDKDAVPLTRS
jgi:hypothetical protein